MTKPEKLDPNKKLDIELILETLNNITLHARDGRGAKFPPMA